MGRLLLGWIVLGYFRYLETFAGYHNGASLAEVHGVVGVLEGRVGCDCAGVVEAVKRSRLFLVIDDVFLEKRGVIMFGILIGEAFGRRLGGGVVVWHLELRVGGVDGVAGGVD